MDRRYTSIKRAYELSLSIGHIGGIAVCCKYYAIMGSIVSRALQLRVEHQQFKIGNLGIAIVCGNITLSIILIPSVTLAQLNSANATLIFFLILAASVVMLLVSRRGVSPIRFIREYAHFNWFTVLFGFFVAIHCLRAALPEVSWDALAYHLPLTKNYELSTKPNFYGALPKGLDIIYWFGHALTSDYTLSKLFHVSHLVAMALFVFSAFKILTTPKIARLVALLVLVYHFSFEIAHTCYVDVGAACMEMISILSCALWIRTADPTFFRLLCLGAGGALAIKYTALIPAAITFSVALSFAMFSDRHKNATKVRPLVLSIIVGIVPALFWYAKNLILFGNPVWPFYLGHRGMPDAEYLQLVYDNLAHFTFPRTLINYLLTPYRLLSGNFENYAISTFSLRGVMNYRLAEFGAFFSICVLFFKGLYQRKDLLFLAIFYFLALTINFWTGSHQARYILSTFYLGVLLTGVFLYFFRFQWKSLLAAAIFCFAYLQNGREPLAVTQYILNPNKVTDYLTQSLHDYPLAVFKSSRRILSRECGYMFELISLRYFDDYEFLRNGRQLQLHTLSGKPDYNQIKDHLRKKGIYYWLTNTQTVDWRKDWLVRIKNLTKDERDSLALMIHIDEVISKSAIRLEGNGNNYLFKL